MLYSLGGWFEGSHTPIFAQYLKICFQSYLHVPSCRGLPCPCGFWSLAPHLDLRVQLVWAGDIQDRLMNIDWGEVAHGVSGGGTDIPSNHCWLWSSMWKGTQMPSDIMILSSGNTGTDHSWHMMGYPECIQREENKRKEEMMWCPIFFIEYISLPSPGDLKHLEQFQINQRCIWLYLPAQVYLQPNWSPSKFLRVWYSNLHLTLKSTPKKKNQSTRNQKQKTDQQQGIFSDALQIPEAPIQTHTVMFLISTSTR